MSSSLLNILFWLYARFVVFRDDSHSRFDHRVAANSKSVPFGLNDGSIPDTNIDPARRRDPRQFL